MLSIFFQSLKIPSTKSGNDKHNIDLILNSKNSKLLATSFRRFFHYYFKAVCAQSLIQVSYLK